MDDVSGKPPGLRDTLPANARRIPIPAAATAQWLADIDDIVELKVTLRTLALLAGEPQRRSEPASIGLDDLLDDTVLTTVSSSDADGSIRTALAAAVGRGYLVACRSGGGLRILLNDEDTQRYLQTADVTALAPSELIPETACETPGAVENAQQPAEPRANIFALYEQHIGPYGHSIAEQLRAAEEEYPADWIAEAIAIAAERNARSWRYIHAVLRAWKTERPANSGADITDAARDISHEHGKPGSDTATDSRSGYLDSYRRRYGRLPWESGEPDRE